jgi:hypothetical protein
MASAFDDMIAQICRTDKNENVTLDRANKSQDLVDKAFHMYKRLKDQGMSDNDISLAFPQCIRFFKFSSLGCAEREKLMKRYNKYASTVGLDTSQYLDPLDFE